MLIRKVLIVCLVLLLGAVFSPVFAATPIMVEKNLFSADRKPPSLQDGSTDSRRMGPGMAIGNIQLDGVVFRNESRSALLRLKNVTMGAPGAHGSAASPFVTVRVGQMVNNYRVTKIGLRSVTLERNGQAYTLGLFSANKIAAPASPPPRATAASVRKRGPGPGWRKGAPVRRPGLPPHPVFPRGFHPRPPRQALGGRMPMPPNRGPAFHGVPGAPANRR